MSVELYELLRKESNWHTVAKNQKDTNVPTQTFVDERPRLSIK